MVVEKAMTKILSIGLAFRLKDVYKVKLWLLRIQEYSIKIGYRQKKKNLILEQRF